MRAGWISAMRMAGQCTPMPSEETPPLHFRLKPKIPLKLRSFISGLSAAFRADYHFIAGRQTLFPARSRPCAKRGKRRKSLRPPGKFAVCFSIEAVCFRKLQKVFFSFGPCTARFLFSAQPKRENGGCNEPAILMAALLFAPESPSRLRGRPAPP